MKITTPWCAHATDYFKSKPHSSAEVWGQLAFWLLILYRYHIVIYHFYIYIYIRGHTHAIRTPGLVKLRSERQREMLVSLSPIS